MFFPLSKLAWFVVAPSNLLIVLCLAGALLLRTRFARLGRILTLSSAALLLILGISPIGSLLLRHLESQFPQLSQEMPDPTGIIVLGGSVDELITAARDQVTLGAAASRMTEAVVLARRFPNARLVFSGGSNGLRERPEREADVARRLWVALGISLNRMSFENKSRNTYENAIFTRDMIRPKPGERWILVTSAYHMPRSVGIFRRVGFPVIPYPVDYRTGYLSDALKPAEEASMGLGRVDLAVREWVGLLAYRLSGKTDALLPGPLSADRVDAPKAPS